MPHSPNKDQVARPSYPGDSLRVTTESVTPQPLHHLSLNLCFLFRPHGPPPSSSTPMLFSEYANAPQQLAIYLPFVTAPHC